MKALYGNHYFQNVFKFTFVRNPWDRLYSAYSYLDKKLGNKKDKLFAENILKGITDFESFFYHVFLPKALYKNHFFFYPQYYFICDNKDRIIVDYIGKVESINNDFIYIKEILNLSDKTLMHLNKSNESDYKTHYNQEMINIVAKLYKKDIELFDYSFKKEG
ncbi:MAG: sulfotransferase family 2 domain-containing protein [Bacteroidales bacterium]|nr:sulfotransferase family 2 domain-containing protein [Bacteroidales bacterium]